MLEELTAIGLSLFSQGSTIDEVRALWNCGRNKAIRILKERLGLVEYAETAKRNGIARFTAAAAKANSGRIRGPMSEETKSKISKGNSGKILSEKTRLKISLSLKERIAVQGNLRSKESYLRGAALAKETKIKNGIYKIFSEKMKGRKRAPHSEIAKIKMSLSRKRFYSRGGQNWNLGKNHSANAIALMSISTRRMWERGAFDSGNGLWRSKLEVRVFDEISSRYKCSHSYRISNKIYDIFIEELNLLIEVNGDYWHLNPSIYEADYLDRHREVKAIDLWKRDAAKHELAKSRGYNVEVVWQRDLNSDFHGAIENVLSRHEGGDHQREASASN
jgi:very-short-patch-repair endonuclease